MKEYITEKVLDYIFSYKCIYDRMDFINGTEITVLIRHSYLVKVRYRTHNHRGIINCRYPMLLLGKYRNCNIFIDVDRHETTAAYEYIKGGIGNGDIKCNSKRRTNRTTTSL